MQRLVLAGLVTLLAAPIGGAQQLVSLKPGMIIDRSVAVRPGVYRLAASEDLKTPALVVRGSHVTIDFNGAVLAGSPDEADPDTMAGVGILIDAGSHVTLKNAVVRGYKVAVLARNSPDLHITRGDFSHNWKQRLYSGIEKESLLDWMSFHQNEKDEWLRYGAAIYLRACDRAEIDSNTAVQGQNGLMVTASTGLKIWNNTFQYLSAIGVGLYRVTHSTLMHNRIDWCVRGYSHGFYNRGQDSAGLLMYEQTSNNTIAYNSITHGGDGLFLWAGQSTMDTGQGGSNDNFFFKNDFSHAPTNGIEATFSRNRFHENRVEECWHGVWGGYSYKSEWVGNRFARNTEAVAIEHGQDNVIAGNTFDGNETAVRLWQNATQDPSWGYAKNRETRSHGYRIAGNEFRNSKTALQIRDTTDVTAIGNRFESVATTFALTGLTPHFIIDPPNVMSLAGDDRPQVRPLAGGIDPMIKEGERRGRETIVVDDWGPYDWKSPKVWPVLSAGAAGLTGPPYKLRVLGPAGDWKASGVRGAQVEPRSGKVGDEIAITPESRPASEAGLMPRPAYRLVDFDVAFEYRGVEVVSPRGTKTAAGQPYTFHYSTFFLPIDWRVTFFEYTDATDPVKQPDGFAKLLSGAPLREITRDRLDYMSGGRFEDGLPRDTFAFVAEGTANLPPGDYTATVISDDGVRVWVDGALALDEWTAHESKVSRIPLEGGRRLIKVQYYEAGGFAELRFDIQRAPPMAMRR
jgi:nitrous oxidase accessory protein NosD